MRRSAGFWRGAPSAHTSAPNLPAKVFWIASMGVFEMLNAKKCGVLAWRSKRAYLCTKSARKSVFGYLVWFCLKCATAYDARGFPRPTQPGLWVLLPSAYVIAPHVVLPEIRSSSVRVLCCLYGVWQGPIQEGTWDCIRIMRNNAVERN